MNIERPGFSPNDEFIEMNESLRPEVERKEGKDWKIIIADDESEVHSITKLVLSNYTFQGKGVKLLSAYTAEETIKMLHEHPDTAIILLDVVMETGNAGLETVKYIREELKNQVTQIILRTGQPDHFLEEELFQKYEINDFKSKNELTAQKLFTTVTASLRAFNLSQSFAKINRELEQELAERKKAEAAVIQSEMKYRRIVETSHDLIWSVDAEGRWDFINRNPAIRIYGLEPEKMIGTYFIDYQSPDQQRPDFLINDALPKTSFNFKTVHFHRDGTPVHLNFTGVYLTDEVGCQVGATGIATDITELIRAAETKVLLESQAKLSHAGRLTALGEMASGMAHEINQPLTIIRLLADSLKVHFKNTAPDTREAESVKKIIDQVKRAANIINNMRTFARTSSPNILAIDLEPPLNIALSFFREQFRINHIDFLVDLEKDLPHVEVDPQRFEQIVVNFLSNAKYAVEKKAMQSGCDYQKTIKVRLFASDIRDQIFLEVEDNGIGMNAETKNRCMDPFYTTKEIGEGTGLGLSIVHGILKEFKMTSEIRTIEGEGTTFRILIPVKKENR